MFWIVILVFGASAALPKVVALPKINPQAVVYGELPDKLQFLNVILVAPSEALALPIQTAVEVAAVLVFTILKFCEVVPLLDPSTVI